MKVSVMNELLENAPMRISLALNVILALGITLLLWGPDATSPGSGLRSVTPTIVAAGEVSDAGKLRDPSYARRGQRSQIKHEVAFAGQLQQPAAAEGERRERVKRKAAQPATSGMIASAVNDAPSVSRSKGRTR